MLARCMKYASSACTQFTSGTLHLMRVAVNKVVSCIHCSFFDPGCLLLVLRARAPSLSDVNNVTSPGYPARGLVNLLNMVAERSV